MNTHGVLAWYPEEMCFQELVDCQQNINIGGQASWLVNGMGVNWHERSSIIGEPPPTRGIDAY